MKQVKTLSELSEDSRLLDLLLESLMEGGVFGCQTNDTEFRISIGKIDTYHSAYGETPRKALYNLAKVIQEHSNVKLKKQLT